MDAGGSVLPISTPLYWRIQDCWVGVNAALGEMRGEKRVNPKGDGNFGVSRNLANPSLIFSTFTKIKKRVDHL
jgi:hypothetical protein